MQAAWGHESHQHGNAYYAELKSALTAVQNAI